MAGDQYFEAWLFVRAVVLPNLVVWGSLALLVWAFA